MSRLVPAVLGQTLAGSGILATLGLSTTWVPQSPALPSQVPQRCTSFWTSRHLMGPVGLPVAPSFPSGGGNRSPSLKPAGQPPCRSRVSLRAVEAVLGWVVRGEAKLRCSPVGCPLSCQDPEGERMHVPLVWPCESLTWDTCHFPLGSSSDQKPSLNFRF